MSLPTCKRLPVVAALVLSFGATAAPSSNASHYVWPSPSPSPSPSPAPSSSEINDSYEQRIVDLVNIERQRAGVRPVAVSACTDRYAEEWSTYMARTGEFKHRPDLGVILRDCKATAVGENIGYGNTTADEMMQLWMNSPGHRANILNARYTHIGVGATRTSTGRVYGVQNFVTL